MSKPRNPFGATHPGRLPSTMVKVLAAEMSDPARLRRGKQYAKDGSVLDIIVEPGLVTCEIQGSRPTPYLTAIRVKPGDGMPLRRDVTCTCTCPDDDNWDGHICKHVVASLFALSNEFLIEPELLDVWRGHTAASDVDDEDDGARDRTPHGSTGSGDAPADTPTRGIRRHLRLVREDELGNDDADQEAEPAVSVFEDSLRPVLRVPPGETLPDIPVLEPADLRPPKDRDLASVLRDALQHVRIEWD